MRTPWIAGRRRGTAGRAALLGAAALSGALVLAACSSPATSPTTTGGSSTTARSTSTTGATGPTTTAAGVACAASALAVSVVGSQGAAGTFELTFALRNTSGTPCPMKGFPGAQLLSSTGAQQTTHVVPGTGHTFTDFAPAQVVLAGGQTAYFNLAYSDVPTDGESSCPTAAKIEITPPGASDHALVTQQMQVCASGTLTVSPVFAQNSPEVQTTAPPPG
ncbi:MAG TPA: DUF4232 domain-containing protein [Acidimicrobiales bacterium]|nr:DUF4232 domain-containing protein [Acidimicrobiales bacterium]